MDTYAKRLAAAKLSLQAAQARMTKTENKKRRNVTYTDGQQVLLSTKNLPLKGSKKLVPKWIGPFPIERMIHPVAARLTLPEGYRFHNVFHVSLLRPYHLDGTVQPPQPPEIDPEATTPPHGL